MPLSFQRASGAVDYRNSEIVSGARYSMLVIPLGGRDSCRSASTKIVFGNSGARAARQVPRPPIWTFVTRPDGDSCRRKECHMSHLAKTVLRRGHVFFRIGCFSVAALRVYQSMRTSVGRDSQSTFPGGTTCHTSSPRARSPLRVHRRNCQRAQCCRSGVCLSAIWLWAGTGEFLDSTPG